MHGGNFEAALAKALKDNNRLAALYRENPDAFQPGGPADPTQLPPEDTGLFREPEPIPPELEPVELDPAAVQGEVNDRVFDDPNARAMVTAFMQNKARIESVNPQTGEPGLNHQIRELEGQIGYETRKMQDPDMASDDLRKGEIESKLMRFQTQLGLLQGERSRLLTDNGQMDQQFRQYRQSVEGQVVAEFEHQAEEQSFTQYEQQVEVDEEARVLREWPTAIQRVITDNQIPSEQIEDFSNDALRAYQAALTDDDAVIDDLYGFLSQVGKDSVARLDRYHRVRSGQYATDAARRAAQPSPPAGPAPPPPPPEAAMPSPEQAMASATAYLKQRMRGG